MYATPLISSTPASAFVYVLTKLQVMAIANFPRNSFLLNFKLFDFPSQPTTTSNSFPFRGEEAGLNLHLQPLPVKKFDL